MDDRKELPFEMPPLVTYHNQACPGVVAMRSPGGMGWYLNNAIQLSVEKKFLRGYTTPLLKIIGCTYSDISVIQYVTVNVKYIYENLVNAIVKMLDEGKYVGFMNADDFYIPGKSWYGVRHFKHDGMIIGYDLEDRTFTLLAYDSAWIFRSFAVPMGCFLDAFAPLPRRNLFGTLYVASPVKVEVPLDIHKILQDIDQYLDSNLDKYPMIDDGKTAYGIVVLKYIAEYLECLRDGRIPYSRMDRRIVRLLLDHKMLMRKRIAAVSFELGLSGCFEEEYMVIVDMLQSMQFQYKKFELRPNMYALERMIENIRQIYERERDILSRFVEVASLEWYKRKEKCIL